ncbi:MAG: bifunctional diaminohydroxyphosphoribosylaminopyrimidine deaminase/5-amino-6-(5-phosphoribosylamino)uracil reductase RibD [Microthrixaceae bacterium]
MLDQSQPLGGAVLRDRDGAIFEGATEPRGAHAEVVAIRAAGSAASGATLYVTLEPCNHTGRTGPCTEAIVQAGIERVVVGMEDPDPLVSGTGIAALCASGIEVDLGVQEEQVRAQLTPYVKHRRTGRPWVVLKLASTLDGGTAAPNGTSKWITSPEARADGHRLRAESDAILVGAGTVRRDDPSLTVRDYHPEVPRGVSLDPRRVVLGSVPAGSRVHPCTEYSGDLEALLDELGRDGIVQLLVEGGAGVAGDFHRAGLVDRYVIYLAPALFGGDDARGIFSGHGAFDIGDLRRGRFSSVERVGDDLRVELTPSGAKGAEGTACSPE